MGLGLILGHVGEAEAGEGRVEAQYRGFYADYAIPAESFARAVAFAVSQPEDVDINEILFRPTRQEV